MKNKRVKTRKQRINYNRVGILFLIILGGVVGIIMLMGNGNTLSHGEIEYKTIYVSNGETLWGISKREVVNNEYYESKDVRFVINEIKNINGLETSDLSVGQVLQIPVL